MHLVEKSANWLSRHALPLWAERGIDSTRGEFYEGLSFNGEVIDSPRRLIVQTRQMYCFHTAAELKLFPKEKAHAIVSRSAAHLLGAYSLPSGAFVHSLNADGTVAEPKFHLYSHAFALFGLAHAFACAPDESYKRRAKDLVTYLRRERRAPHGGFVECGDNGLTFAANPHMHLFEAALAWAKIDEAPEWKNLADELLELCLTRFIDPHTGILAEHFDSNWAPIRDNTRFLFEPGHHFEWSWLLGVHQAVRGGQLLDTRERLFQIAELHGICPERRVAYDEVWSDFSVKKKTSRYWPQCERVKAALRLAEATQQSSYLIAADEGMTTLFRFLETPIQGMSFDYMLETGGFSAKPPMASCLYHIVNAMEEYINIRPRLIRA